MSAEHIPIVVGILLLYLISSSTCYLLIGFLVGIHYGKTLNLDLPQMYEEMVLPKSRKLIDKIGIRDMYGLLAANEDEEEDDKTD